MRENGTDRDVAQMILSNLSAIKDAVAAINTHLYAPIIFTQPVDVEADNGESAEFTVVAGNVDAYQWQRKQGDNDWASYGGTGATTATLSIASVTAPFYNFLFRCRIKGLDGTYIYTDAVKVTAPPTPDSDE